jgi:hypothetical protein
MLVAGCGGSSRPLGSKDAMPSSDAATHETAVDDARPDEPRRDGGLDAGMDSPCYVPTDCPSGLTCCLVFDGTGGTVSCRATCDPKDGISYLACATTGDCPPAVPNCVFLAPTTRGDFSICE